MEERKTYTDEELSAVLELLLEQAARLRIVLAAMIPAIAFVSFMLLPPLSYVFK